MIMTVYNELRDKFNSISASSKKHFKVPRIIIKIMHVKMCGVQLKLYIEEQL